MKKKIATFVSIIFHPLLMPLIGVFLLFHSGSYLTYYPFEGQKAIYIIVLISTILLPMSFIPFFVFIGLIKSITMKTRKERVAPYILTLVFYYFAYYILRRAGAPSIVISFILASIITLSVTILVSLRWKISAHMIGLGGLAGALLALSYRLALNTSGILMIVILSAGIIGTTRLYLEEHKASEIYSGFGVGVVFTLLTVIFL
ncbi:MAG: hypothetical protein GXO79_11645 [Chlorobi bacterium]|nr:hypothetical protein [Chlorobiota bacterium]